MRRLLETSGETVNMGIENDGYVVFVSQMECHHSIRAFHRPGARAPMHATSLGKAILASLTEQDVSERLRQSGMPRLTSRTITDPDALLSELAAVRRRGWAIDDQEVSDGLRCVGAAIYNEHGETLAAISIAGPIVRMSDDRVDELGPMVKRAAAEITERVGGKIPQL